LSYALPIQTLQIRGGRPIPAAPSPRCHAGCSRTGVAWWL